MVGKKIKIAIVDDHKLFREGLAALLKDYEELSILFEACNGADFFEKLKTCKKDIDVLVLDVEMPEMDGLQVLKKLKVSSPGIRTLVLTMHNEDELIYELVESGAKGFLQKNADIEEVVNAIHKIAGKELYFNEDISIRVLKRMVRKEDIKAHKVYEGISERERQIIKLMCNEFTTTEIAEQLSLSERTVETHRKHIIKKLRVKNLAGVVMYAMKTGIVD